MPIDFAYRHRLSVRFRDCDAMGHVNHAVYFTYLEQCRLTYWRELTGTPAPHTRVIIARAECDYRAPAHFGDELEVRVNIEAIGRSSFTLVYEIVKVGGGHLIAGGKTVMVIGYGGDTVTILDGGTAYTRSRAQFLASWGVLGNMAVLWGSP